LRPSWVNNFVSGEMDNWNYTTYTYFRQFGKNWWKFSMNIEHKKLKIKQLIWGNKCIMLKNKSLIFDN
jgi:hypothetical protein